MLRSSKDNQIRHLQGASFTLHKVPHPCDSLTSLFQVGSYPYIPPGEEEAILSHVFLKTVYLRPKLSVWFEDSSHPPKLLLKCNPINETLRSRAMWDFKRHLELCPSRLD